MKPVVAFLIAILLSGCGQTGALYLPDESVQTPVEIRTESEAEKNKDEDKKPTPPPGR